MFCLNTDDFMKRNKPTKVSFKFYGKLIIQLSVNILLFCIHLDYFTINSWLGHFSIPDTRTDYKCILSPELAAIHCL